MRVIIRYPRTTVRWGNAQHLQLGLERMRLLCRAIISMQYQRFVTPPVFAPASPFNQRRGLVAAFTCMDFPPPSVKIVVASIDLEF